MQNEVVCDYFCLIDPDFLEWAKEVIDNLLCESVLERDWVLDDCSAQLWSREDDMRMAVSYTHLTLPTKRIV